MSRAPDWEGPLRVGFRDSPPFYYRSPEGEPQGLAVDVMKQAAGRTGLSLAWVFLNESTDAALREGRIDVWTTMPIYGGRSPHHITEPWLLSSYFLVFRRNTPVGSLADIAGHSVAMLRNRFEPELAAKSLPGVIPRFITSTSEKLQAVCDGSARAAFVEGREGQGALLSLPASCQGVALGFYLVEGATLPYGIGSTPAAAAVADRLRSEIAEMAVDGVLAGLHADWSFTTANELLVVYALQQARTRSRLALYGAMLLALGLVIALAEIRRNRQARRLAEEHARQEERYRVLFERNVAGVYRSDVEGHILDCNDAFAKMLGCDSRGDVMRRKAWEFYPDRAAREASLALLRERRSVANEEIVVRRADGKSAVLLESSTIIDSGDGTPPIIEGTVLDITRLRELEDQYRQAQKLESIGLLAGGVAHDFNNTLTAIGGYAELVLSAMPETDPNSTMLREIQKASQHAASLTRQLLAFSRRQHLQPEVINLNAIIGDVRSLLRRVIGEDVELVTELNPALDNVRADPGQIQQVIMNLAVNARDAMPGGGRLTISTMNVLVPQASGAEAGSLSGALVRLTVADTGHGIDGETQQRVFEPFFTTKERGKGTGLGLSTVYGIVKQSGGHIRLRSAPGEGASFEVDLPRAEESVTAAVSAAGGDVLRGTETILVVEDQAEVRRVVEESLSRYGYRVLSAPDGESAIGMCRRHDGPIQLLLADVVMPGMTGPAVADACRDIRPEVKTLFMSGYTDNVLRRELSDADAAGYLQKPFTPVQLATKVRSVLG